MTMENHRKEYLDPDQKCKHLPQDDVQSQQYNHSRKRPRTHFET